jgi:sulfate permease, SulP family
MAERFELIHGLRFDNLKGDIFGGLTAAVVALPLALAFGVASGAGPLAGLWGAILVGFFAALFGGTPSQVSGPTGPMTVITAGIVMQYAHDPAIAFTVIMMAGGIQIILGLSGVGRYIHLMPMPVVSGFMSGIGCIIIALQLGPLVGHAAKGSVVDSIVALPTMVGAPIVDAAIVGLLSLGIMWFLPGAIKRIIPPPLVALVVGTLCAVAFLPGAPVLGEIPTGFPEPTLPTVDLDTLRSMLESAFVLALLGMIDSLLTSLVADNVTQTHHRPNRELIGQGIGNMVAGLFGAIPGAGATMRTVINVRAGGRTPISGALHAVVLVAVVLGLGPLASHIPHAVLAGILIKVGFDIVDWGYLKRARRAPKAGLILMMIVLVLTVFVDLIVAVMVGLVLASLLLTKRMADLQMASLKTLSHADEDEGLSDEEKAILRAGDGHITVFALRGPFSFGAATGVTRRIAQEDGYSVLILDMSEVPMIDSSASFALEEVIRNATSDDRYALLVGLRPSVRAILDQVGVLDLLPDGHVHMEREPAIRHAASLLDLTPDQ